MAKEQEEIVFWTLRQKFLDSRDTLPEQPRQVMYYSLAIGHHVGVIDCLQPVLRCPLDDFRLWAAELSCALSQRKMLGVLTFGEIVVDASHIGPLRRALAPLIASASPFQPFSEKLSTLLDDIAREPAIYLLVRKSGTVPGQ